MRRLVIVGVAAAGVGGCASAASHEVSRSGEAITVRVWNSQPAGNPICTAIYGTYELGVDLGTEFRSGAAYTVRVNDKATTFRAQ